MSAKQTADDAPRERQRAEKRTMPFTEMGVTRQSAPETGQIVIWEESKNYRGLHLLVSGGTKSYRTQVKLNGKWISFALGRHGGKDADGRTIGVAWAHQQHARARELAADGIDPRPKKRDAVTGQLVEVSPTSIVPAGTERALYKHVVNEFIRDYATPRQRTHDATRWYLERKGAAFMDRPIAEITKAEIKSVLTDMTAKGQHANAALTFRWFKTFWLWAYRNDYVPTPLVDKVEFHADVQPRDRVFGDDEIKAIWTAADALDPIPGAFVKLAVLLVPRKTALAKARRSHLDDAEHPTLWTTPHELTKSRKRAVKKRVYHTPLPALAAKLIKSLPADEAYPDLLFPSSTVKGVPIDPGSSLVRDLKAAGAPDDFFFHALRHTVATWLETRGHSEYERGVILNHASTTVTAGYSHGSPVDLKRSLLELWSDHVESLVTPKPVRKPRRKAA